MSDNLLQTLQQLVQDVLAPDVRELKVRDTSLERQVESLEKHIEARFTALDKQMDARFPRHAERHLGVENAGRLTNLRLLSTLSERLAVLGMRHQ